MVWSSAAAGQLDAFINQGAAMRDSKRDHFRVVIEPEVDGGTPEDTKAVCNAIGHALGESELLEECITKVAMERQLNVAWGVRRERWVKQPQAGEGGAA